MDKEEREQLNWSRRRENGVRKDIKMRRSYKRRSSVRSGSICKEEPEPPNRVCCLATDRSPRWATVSGLC